MGSSTGPCPGLAPEAAGEADGAAAAGLARTHRAKLRVISGKALQTGFPMIHAVGQASPRAPRLIDMTWGPARAPKITLVGTEAGAEWPNLDVFGERNGSTTDTRLQYSDNGVGGHQQEIAAFTDAILNNKPSPVPAEQSLKVIRILDGLYRSYESGKEVTV